MIKKKNDSGAVSATEGDAVSCSVPTPELSHAATPWHQGPHYRTDIYNRNGFVAECRPMQTPYAEANAEFIVRACNSHDELVEALKKAKQTIRDWHGEMAWDLYQDSPEMRVINAALAKASGRS